MVDIAKIDGNEKIISGEKTLKWDLHKIIFNYVFVMNFQVKHGNILSFHIHLLFMAEVTCIQGDW